MKTAKRFLSIMFLLLFSVCLVACSGGTATCKNGHPVDDEWKHDESTHYLVCGKCGDVISNKHNLKWIVTSEAVGTTSEIKSEYCEDCGYYTGKTDSVDVWDGEKVTASDVFASKIRTLETKDSKGRFYNEVNVNTGADLVTAFAEISNHQNFKIKLTGDIDLNNKEWTPAYVNGYAAGDVEIVIDGNYHKISGLTDMLIEKSSTGGAKIIVENLAIENSIIDSDCVNGVGAIIGTAYGNSKVTINNCTISDCQIKGGNNTGALVGCAGGNSGAYTKIFENVEISNCNIINTSIGGRGYVGAIIGTATTDAWTKVIIKDCALVNNRITSTGQDLNSAGVVIGCVGVAGLSKTVQGTTHTGGTYIEGLVETDNSVISYTSIILRLYGVRGENTAQLYVNNIAQF